MSAAVGGAADARQLLIASTAMALFVGTHTMLSLFVPLYAVVLGASPAVVGALVSLAFVLPLFLAMPIGGFVDRIGSRGPVSAACATLAVVPLVVWVWPSLWSLAVLQTIGGVAHLTLIVGAQRHVSNLGRGRAAERNFGWYSTFQSGGQMVGPLLGGVLIDLLGYGSAFLSAGLLAGVALVLARFMRAGQVPGPRERAAAPLSPYGGRGQVRSLLANDGMRMAIVISGGVLVAQSVRQTFFPVYLEQLQYAATTIGMLLSLRALMSMLVRPFMPQIVRAFGDRSLTALVMFGVLALGLGMTAFVESLVPLALTSLLVGLGSGITQPLSIVTVTDHVQRERVGFALGLRLTWNRLAQVTSPFLFGLVAEVVGVSTAFVVSAATLLVSGSLILLWRAGFERAERRNAVAEREPGVS